MSEVSRNSDTVAPARAESTARYFSLDVLRGVAILLVLIRHLPAADAPIGGAVEAATQAVSRVGWIGVDLFFVLSGFLISGLVYAEVDRRGRFDSLRFWLRRGMKIWPAYFVAYGGATLLRAAWQAYSGNADAAPGIVASAGCNALFLQNYVACTTWPHSWSLAVEEHFYTLFALVVGVAGAMSRAPWRSESAFRAVVPTFVLVAAAALALRAVVVAADPLQGRFDAYYQSHLRFDSLACGVFLGFVSRYHQNRIPPSLLRWPAVTLALLVAFVSAHAIPIDEPPLGPTIGLTINYLAFAVVVAAAGSNPRFGSESAGAAGMVLRPLARLGIYSYTVYLVHSIVFLVPGAETARVTLVHVLEPAYGNAAATWTVRALFLLLSIGGGVTLSHAVERPFLRLRERVLPTRGGTAAVT